jgi:hypothetical protein
MAARIPDAQPELASSSSPISWRASSSDPIDANDAQTFGTGLLDEGL